MGRVRIHVEGVGKGVARLRVNETKINQNGKLSKACNPSLHLQNPHSQDVQYR